MTVKLIYTPGPDQTPEEIEAEKQGFIEIAKLAAAAGVTQLNVEVRRYGRLRVAYIKEVGPPPAWRWPKLGINIRRRRLRLTAGWRMTVYTVYASLKALQP